MKRTLTGLLALAVLGWTAVGPSAVAEPSQADWRADTIKVELADPPDDVRLESVDGEVPGSVYEQTELRSTRIVIKRDGRTPQLRLTVHAVKVWGPNATIRGHQALQSFGVDIGKTPDLVHTAGFQASNRNDRIQTFHDLDAPHRCRGAHRKIDTAHDTFTITVPLTCLKWTGMRWGRISAFSVLFVRGVVGKSVDESAFTRALPLVAK